MVDLTTRAPEVQPDVERAVGTDRATFDLSNFGRSFANLLDRKAQADYYAARGQGDIQDRIDDEAKGRFALALMDQNLQEQLSILEAAGLNPGPYDATSLQRAKRTAEKLEKIEIQNPNRAVDTFRRTLEARRYMAANPALAPEMLDIFMKASGESVGALTQKIIEEGDRPYVDYAARVNAAREAMGDYSSSEEEVLAKANKVTADAVRAKNAQDILNAYVNTEQYRGEVALDMYFSDVFPPAMRNLAEDILARARKTDRSKLTPEDIEGTILELNTIERKELANISRFGKGKLDPKYIDQRLAPLRSLRDTYIAFLNGDVSLKTVENAAKFTEAASENDFFREHPDAVKVLPFFNNFGPHLPDAWQTEVGLRPLYEVLGKMGTQLGAQKINPLVDFQSKFGTERGYKEFANLGKMISNLVNASDKDMAPYVDQIIGYINSMSNSIDPENLDTRAFKSILPTLSNGRFWELVENQADPIAFNNFKEATIEYFKQSVDEINQRLSEATGGQMKPKDMTWQAAHATGMTRDIKDIVSVTISATGYPTFKLNPKKIRNGDPEELRRIEEQLQRNFAPQLRDLIAAQAGADRISPQEAGIAMINAMNPELEVVPE